MKRRTAALTALALFLAAASLMAGCSSLDERQRAWIFQPSDRAWGNSAELAAGMEDRWIEFPSKETGQPAKLHALWAPSAHAHAPVMLFLHGARWNVEGSAPRIRRMQELGFSVLAVDYRGFGRSTAGLPSEAMAYEDARAAWDWLAAKYPNRPRYIFGHSLGGAIAIDLAAQVGDERGVIVEGTFTSIADVIASTRWGWVPVGPLLTQRFETLQKVGRVGSPLLVVHGSRDSLVLPSLGKKLYEAAAEPKAWVLVEGGSHHNAGALGLVQYRQAIAKLFAMG